MNSSTTSQSIPAAQRDGSVCLTEHLLKDHADSHLPTLICFHGSGTVGHLETWASLLESLEGLQCRVVFFDRGPKNQSPGEHVEVLWDYLTTQNLAGPYVLIAHSYGGTFAKHFMYTHRHSVGGAVLAETGKADFDRHIEAKLYQRGRQDRISLSVIRANSAVRQWQALFEDRNSQAHASLGEGDVSHDNQKKLDQREETLRHHDEADEELEKQQLKLSSRSRYLHLPDCGHNVIKERPDVVTQEVQWVLQQYRAASAATPESWLKRVMRWFLNT